MAFENKNYGEISIRNNTTETTITNQNEWVQFEVFDTEGISKEIIPSAVNSDVVSHFDVRCLATASISFCKPATPTSATYEFELRKNNGTTVFNNINSIRKLDTTAPLLDIGSVSMNGIIDLETGDTLELWIRNITSTANVLIVNATLSVVRID